MTSHADRDTIIAELAAAASDPVAYAKDWQQRTGGKIIGILPMNFPPELVRAAGALPVILQEDERPITYGRRLIHEFYCGYTRSLVDQAITGALAHYDAVYLVDHCVALLGAADAIRNELPDLPVHLAQFPASMDESASAPQVRQRMNELCESLGALCGLSIRDEALQQAIGAYNHNRRMLRQIFDLRKEGRLNLSGRQIRALVQSSMVMDIGEHNRRMEALIPLLTTGSEARADVVRLHLSGHLCHAPRAELLDMIESCGAVIADDDLYTGKRHIATDVPVSANPLDALTEWYFARNTNTPCPTRAQMSVDWESSLTEAISRSRAQGVITLLAKFCEPHMLYYPELRKELSRRAIPHLLVETEHEGLALESLRTRIEALIEGIRHPALQA